MSLFAGRVYRHLSKRAFATTHRALADHVRVIEVGPRDGLQNEKTSISVQTKVELVRRLAKTGVQCIEAGSFVAPKWVPQMAASDLVLQAVLNQTPPSPRPISYQWLLPNSKGLDNFLRVVDQHPSPAQHDAYPTPPPSPQQDAGPALNTSSQDPNDMPSSTSGTESMSQPRSASQQAPGSPKHEISVFLAATDAFSRANTNCTVSESLERSSPLISRARQAGYPVRAYISVALGCPFEGPDTNPHKVAELAASLLEMGADEISVADTTGMGTAPRTRKLLHTLREAGIRNSDLAMHFHDTFGQALVNTMVSLEHGIRAFDSAVGGLGGCPYSPGATGNVATEDLVYTLHSLGADTGIDLEEMSRIGAWITSEIGKENSSSAGRATLARLRRESEKT